MCLLLVTSRSYPIDRLKLYRMKLNRWFQRRFWWILGTMYKEKYENESTNVSEFMTICGNDKIEALLGLLYLAGYLHGKHVKI